MRRLAKMRTWISSSVSSQDGPFSDSVGAAEVDVFGVAAAGLPRPMKLFDSPARAIAVDDALGVRELRHGTVREQDPVNGRAGVPHFEDFDHADFERDPLVSPLVRREH